MNIADLRYRTAVPSSQPDVVGVYSSGDGFVFHKASGNTEYLVGTKFTGILPQNSVQVKTSITNITGVVFTSNQSLAVQTGLASPAIWIPVYYNSTGYLVPGWPINIV